MRTRNLAAALLLAGAMAACDADTVSHKPAAAAAPDTLVLRVQETRSGPAPWEGEQTRWTSGGNLYAVSFRPLLPDEHTCGDLDVR